MKISWVKSWKINNNGKRYFDIDSGTFTDQIFALLHPVQSENEYENDELMNDSDTEFIASEEIDLTKIPGNTSVLTSEANVQAVDEGTTHTKELQANKMRKKPEVKIPITWKRKFLHILERIAFLRADFPNNLKKVLQLSISIKKSLILMFWLIDLFNNATSIRKKTGGTFSPVLRKWKLSLFSVTSWL